MLRGIGRLRAGGGLERALYALFATQDGYWRDPSDLSTSFQDSAGTTAGAVDSAVGKALDKSGRGNHVTQATGGSRPILKLVSGYYGDQFDGLDDFVVSTSGGGGSAGFFYCGAVYVGGGATTNRVIWSDIGTNTGYHLRVDSSDKLALLAGNGAAYTTATTAGTLPVGETHVVTAYDDGTNLSVQIDSGTAATTARPAVSAGTAGFTEGRANGASSQYITGRLGTRVYFKGYCPDAATREQIKRYIAIRSGVSL